ncbi:MAG: ATP-binding protein [Chloroherpetonaceae bacterium]
MKFEDFDFGEKYQDAHLSRVDLPQETLEKIIEWNRKPQNFLIFCGNPGVGKTYLCAALCKECLDRKQPVYYLTEHQYFNKLRSVIQRDWDYEFEIKKLCEYPFVIIDDIGSSQMTEWQKEVLFSFVDLRSRNNFPTFLTSNFFIDDFREKFHSRFVSRLLDRRNTVIELNWIDKRRGIHADIA